jgi:hypothetical protein
LFDAGQSYAELEQNIVRRFEDCVKGELSGTASDKRVLFFPPIQFAGLFFNGFIDSLEFLETLAGFLTGI